MDRKTKHRLAILRERIQKLQKQLAGAKSQDDEPGEVERLEAELEKTKQDIEKLKSS